ncbi:MAG: MFS transporter, partial [Rhodobacteraceae bacterium]|nr:MFS transporter [Paracoccaceae bacterium]
VNDYLDSSDMAAASAGLIFINGVGAISGPIVTGWMMGAIGPSGFFLFMALIFGALALYAAWRMTQRRSTPEASGTYTAMSPTASVISVEAALERSETDSPPH